jgi:hypothetical protein
VADPLSGNWPGRWKRTYKFAIFQRTILASWAWSRLSAWPRRD